MEFNNISGMRPQKESFKKPTKKIIYFAALIFCLALFFSLGTWVGSSKLAYCVQQPGTINFSLFWDAYGKLKQNFVSPEKIDDQKVVYGAIQGMAKTLGDPYTVFFTPEEAKRFQQDLSGSFEGIGVEIGIRKNQLTVIAPLEGTPGQRAGLKPGDIIVKIADKDTTGMATEEAVSLIRGPRGTKITLTIFREGWEKTKDFEITRDTIKILSLTWAIRDTDVAYIQIHQFDQALSNGFKNIALQIAQSPAEKIVLDLRDNPGGYLEVAQEIAGWFLEPGQTVTIEDFGDDKQQKEYKTEEGAGSLADYPVVVLINEGSASASEILAGALRDNRNIKLIGVKSFGKGSVQELLDLRGGSYLKITIAKWLTPKGNSISEVGLEPDIKVENTDQDADQDKDPQLDKALEIIRALK